MRVAIMQPYFLPYIGYFQLLAHADRFVVYDDIQFTKKGWIHRNRYLRNGEAVLFTLPLRKDSDYLDVRDRQISEAYNAQKTLAQISSAYRNAPQFDTVMPLIEEVFGQVETNLFDFVHKSLTRLSTFLEIDTPIIVSSSLGDTTTYKGQDRVLAICDGLGATEYVNPIGGLDLYQAPVFRTQGIQLRFMRRTDFSYAQFSDPFVPDLSILDVLMFNSIAEVRSLIGTCYEMVAPRYD
ncbi:WbqC family protein [Ruegeria arenilitoris]|uniref:WbqC family protein n=1 Tax=Ruegeria arenilitoris TaxID=1173585 RepID=UPI001480CF78|nr:WbqC family protein [Ruegeria arenilitoris]